MKKRIFAIISLAVMAAMIFTACSAKGDEAANGTTDASEAVSVSEESTTEATTATVETTTVTTTKKAEQTSKKPAAQTTTKKQQTAPKQTTTKAAPKQTTTQKKTTTTQKNVSAKEVQAQVNSYIKSKGVKVDTSMTPANASWPVQTSALQKHLNDGRSLRNCKGDVDMLLSESKMQSMYCYYDSSEECFYILYWQSLD